VNRPSDLDRTYLKALLSRLDARLARLVLLWRQSGQDPGDRFRGLYINDASARSLATRKPGSNWGSGLQLDKADQARLDQDESRSEKLIRQIKKDANRQQATLRLLDLRARFGLSEFEWWALIVILAPSLDLRYEQLYSYLQDDVTRKHASVDLCLNLLSADSLERLDDLHFFHSEAPLQRWRLIVPIEDGSQPASSLRQSFVAAPEVVSWILGEITTSGSRQGRRAYIPADAHQFDQPSAIFSQPGIPSARILENIAPFLCLSGRDAHQHDLTARQLAAAVGRDMLQVWLPSGGTRADLLETLTTAARDSRLLDAWLYLQNAESLIDADGYLLGDALEILAEGENVVIFSSRVTYKLNPSFSRSDHPLMNLEFDNLTSAERKDLWLSLLEGFLDDVPDQELTVLSGQFSLTSGQILAASSTAISSALQHGRALQTDDLFRAAQFHSGHHLNELAQKINPRYGWEDLILSDTPLAMLQELVQMVKDRPLVLEGWKLGRKLAASNGISALFSGPPGTGKTLSAQIIASELGIDLYRIDLSTVVSKYVGETEKNLEKIFSEASESNAILFFDEADTIFGKRSEVKDAQDRYANLEVGYLLQRMESYNGLAILATNLKANLDDAFTRRLHFIINFPFPNEADRLRIWQVLVPPELPLAEDVDFALMAKRFKLAGGNIRNILLSAAYYAAENGHKVNMHHLMHGARRELQKMGKLVQESDFVLN
jgi:hypothetical protein